MIRQELLTGMHLRLMSLAMVFFLMLLMLPLPVSANHTYTLNEGTFHLESWDFGRQGTVSLEGPWEFYWDALLDPGDLPSESAQKKLHYAQVPHVWGPGYSAAPERQGKGTYRMWIKLSKEEAGKLKSLYIQSVASAYRIWINGELQGGNGTVGSSSSEMSPKNYGRVYSFIPKEGANEVVIQVSNYVQRKGGLWSPIVFGTMEEVNRLRAKNVVSQLFIGSALFTLGLYHFATFLLRKKDMHISLLTGVACLMLTLRSLLLGDTMLVSYIPSLSWEWMVKVEYWCVFLAVPMFAWFIGYTFPKEALRPALKLATYVSTAYSLVVLVFPARVYTYTMPSFEVFLVAASLYLFYVVFRAFLAGRIGSGICLFAGIVMISTVFHDVLYYNHWVKGFDLTPYGVLLFFFAQTMVVVKKFSKAYDEVESLSGELSEINLKLEEKIQERTKALEVTNSYLVYANEHLNRLENSRRELIANITHELGTPMTSIQGFMKAFLDGVVQPEKQYIQIIYDKIQLADRLVQDLFDLTKLEEGQTSFHLVDVIVEELFQEQFSMYRLDVENNGIRFELLKPECPGDVLPVIRVDPMRLRQVLGNLIGNALNYTPEGGTITVKGVYSQDKLNISVADTGVGIEPEVLPYVFDRFVKGSGPRRNPKGGTGLGLAIAKEIVLHHGGILQVESELGKGTVFSFDIPVEFIPMVVD